MKTDFVPFVLGRFIFPGIKKKKATTFTIMGSWEERKSKWNRDSILLFEYLKKKKNNSKTVSYFAKFKKKKKSSIWTGESMWKIKICYSKHFRRIYNRRNATFVFLCSWLEDKFQLIGSKMYLINFKIILNIYIYILYIFLSRLQTLFLTYSVKIVRSQKLSCELYYFKYL